MTEFLTGNRRLAYPLEHELPEGVPALWSQLLLDACVCVPGELEDGQRVSLLSVRRVNARLLRLKVGVRGTAGVQTVDIAPTAERFAVVAATSASAKAVLVVDGETANALLAAGSLPDTDVDVDVPFALRCCSAGHRRVTSIEAYGTPSCETRRWAGHGSETPAGTAAGDVVLAAKDGVDVEAVAMAPAKGRLLRVSAIAAPADSERGDERVHMMVRGDPCFTVETLPGVKSVNGVLFRDANYGVVRIGTVCKPCCQCEDYAAAANMLHARDDEAAGVKDKLDIARARYNEALGAFNAAKAAAVSAINTLTSGVQTSAVATLNDGALYSGSSAAGTRQRLSIALRAVNMTLKQVFVAVGADAEGSGFSGPAAAGYAHAGTSWTRVGAVPESGTGRPAAGVVLKPGESLVVVATYTKTGTTGATASKPAGMTAYVDARFNASDPYTSITATVL